MGSNQIAFNQQLTLYFIFNKKQLIKFELINVDTSNVVGNCQTTLAQLIAAHDSTAQLDLYDLTSNKTGTVLIKQTKSSKESQAIMMDV